MLACNVFLFVPHANGQLPRPCSGVLAQEAAGTLVLFNLQKASISRSKRPEAVWGLCDGKRSVAEIAHSISQGDQQD
ncbi:MAG: hypothetical protein U1G07_21980 [Verrucomicrobiota bacterium]